MTQTNEQFHVEGAAGLDIDEWDYDVTAEDCVSEWAIDSDEAGNPVLCENRVTENLRVMAF